MLIKGVSETIENKTKKQKSKLLSMLLGTLPDSLFGIMVVGEAKILGQGVIIVKTYSKRN